MPLAIGSRWLPPVLNPVFVVELGDGLSGDKEAEVLRLHATPGRAIDESVSKVTTKIGVIGAACLTGRNYKNGTFFQMD
jgi:hypothetical protein